MGRPPIEEFLTKVPAIRVLRMAGSTQCRVEGCANAGGDRGWCRHHSVLWRKADEPDDFALTAPSVPTIAACRVPDCARPKVAAVHRLYYMHRRRWIDAGRPPIEEFSLTVKAVGLVQKTFVFVDLPAGPKLELQYAVQHRRDALGSRVRPPGCACCARYSALAGRRAGPASADDLVFTAPGGGPLRHNLFTRRQFKPAVRAVGLPADLRFHDLRHTFAAFCIASTADPYAVMRRTGHSSIKVTYDTYGHLFPERDEQITASLEELNRRVSSPGTRTTLWLR